MRNTRAIDEQQLKAQPMMLVIKHRSCTVHVPLLAVIDFFKDLHKPEAEDQWDDTMHWFLTAMEHVGQNDSKLTPDAMSRMMSVINATSCMLMAAEMDMY